MVSRGVLVVGHEDGGVVLLVPSTREVRVLGDKAHSGIAHSSRVLSVAISGDGLTVASASADRSFKLCDVASGAERLCVKGHDSTGECVCERRCPVFGNVEPMDNAVSVWDPAEGKALLNLPLATEPAPLGSNNDWGPPGAGVRAVVFSPDGRTLASGHEDGTLSAWDARTGARHSLFRGASAISGRDFGTPVLALAFGRDCVRDERCVAFAMGHHERLGAASRVGALDAGVVRLVLDAM